MRLTHEPQEIKQQLITLDETIEKKTQNVGNKWQTPNNSPKELHNDLELLTFDNENSPKLRNKFIVSELIGKASPDQIELIQDIFHATNNYIHRSNNSVIEDKYEFYNQDFPLRLENIAADKCKEVLWGLLEEKQTFQDMEKNGNDDQKKAIRESKEIFKIINENEKLAKLMVIMLKKLPLFLNDDGKTSHSLISIPTVLKDLQKNNMDKVQNLLINDEFIKDYKLKIEDFIINADQDLISRSSPKNFANESYGFHPIQIQNINNFAQELYENKVKSTEFKKENYSFLNNITYNNFDYMKEKREAFINEIFETTTLENGNLDDLYSFKNLPHNLNNIEVENHFNKVLLNNLEKNPDQFISLFSNLNPDNITLITKNLITISDLFNNYREVEDENKLNSARNEVFSGILSGKFLESLDSIRNNIDPKLSLYEIISSLTPEEVLETKLGQIKDQFKNDPEIEKKVNEFKQKNKEELLSLEIDSPYFSLYNANEVLNSFNLTTKN
ncbi:MAG: hypothetical protein HRT47_02420 [Candidatus Caenarcaniphilales bacterium]|nr:hypothetical protein [Candidatus Caenarcaniphilales bacterium]